MPSTPITIVVQDKGHCVLSDFGLATKLKEDKLEKSGSYGTPGYLPPEMIEGKTHSFAADWYAYGCMLYCLLRGLVSVHLSSILFSFLPSSLLLLFPLPFPSLPFPSLLFSFTNS